MHPQTSSCFLRHPRFKLALLCAALATALHPRPAVAKLGEDMPALIKRFGSNYQPFSPGQGRGTAYKFESKNFAVTVILVKEHSVLEYYYSDHALINGRPPESIWHAVREKNVPGAKWLPDNRGGFTSADYRYTSWFDTANLPANYTYGLAISDRLALVGEKEFAALVHKSESSVAAPEKAAGNPALPTVRGIAYDPAHHGYLYPYFQAAEAEGKQVYAARSYSRLDCKVYDYPGNFVSLAEGEPLHVISVDPETYSLTVSRPQFNTIAHLPQDCVTIR